MPFVYFHRGDGQHFHRDRDGRYVVDERQVQVEAKKMLAKYLVESATTTDTIGLSVEAQDLSGRTIFQASVIGTTW